MTHRAIVAVAALALAACPSPPGDATPAPPASSSFDTGLLGPLRLIVSSDGARLAALSVARHAVVIAALDEAPPRVLARFDLAGPLGRLDAVWSPDARRLLVSAAVRDAATERTVPLHAIIDLRAAPPTLTPLDGLGFASQIAWGPRAIVLADASVTELDPTYYTPN
ncbi:MAG: hypothetical protein IT385_12035, partial [Deltaproteobacteria bacterium]|nr:hypothetical protein [Deltaproteobacteria bacterium]